MDDAKSQLVDKLKSANNVLVTVSRNPSVDQLSALLGLTLLLNKQGKHTAAVFSGEVPSTIEFLQPEETIEKNTDSLRDFIIALDKSKADKLRYKVEDNVVRIFITPYKTSISQDDLDFSQGDFNVDVVVALGVQQQGDLDEAITAHGRILHDAAIASINISGAGDLGSINWHDEHASSLSELVTELVDALDSSMLDNQIATALLTGIVAETDRFSNEKTSSQTMTVSAKLMTAGANQQLVASKLAEPPREAEDTDNKKDDAPTDLHSDDDKRAKKDKKPSKDDGSIDIDHGDKAKGDDKGDDEAPETPEPNHYEGPDDKTPPDMGTGHQDAQPLPEDTSGDTLPAPKKPAASVIGSGSKLITEPPKMGGTLTANSQVESLSPSTDPLSMPAGELPQLLDHDAAPAQPGPSQAVPELAMTVAPLPRPPVPQPEPAGQVLTPPLAAWNPSDTAPSVVQSMSGTLSQLEAAVDSPHTDPANLNSARDEVSKAIDSSAEVTDVASEPIAALNAQPFGGDLHQLPGANDLASPGPHLDDVLQHEQHLSRNASAPAVGDQAASAPTPQVTDSTAPPPVPPPIPFQFGSPGTPPAPQP